MTGKVQRAIAAAFEAQPTCRFTTRELAAIAYPDRQIGRSQMVAVTRAITSITPAVTHCRVGAIGRFGWHHMWGRA